MSLPFNCPPGFGGRGCSCLFLSKAYFTPLVSGDCEVEGERKDENEEVKSGSLWLIVSHQGCRAPWWAVS